MPIAKKTVIDQIEINRSGAYQIRMALVIDEDGSESDLKWHRTLVWNSGQVDATFSAVNAHLATMNQRPVPPAAIARVRAIITAVEAVIGWKDPPAP